MERYLRVRESTCFLRNMCLKGKKLHRKPMIFILMSTSLSTMYLAQIRYNLTVGQMEIFAREVCNLYKGCRISFFTFSSFLSSIAILRTAQTEEKDGGSCDFAPIRQFLLTLQYLEIMINCNLMNFIPESEECSWLCKWALLFIAALTLCYVNSKLVLMYSSIGLW